MRGPLGYASLRAIVAAAAVLFAVAVAPVAAATAAPSTTVTFTFDDGRPSQLAAEQELVSRGMNATFYIITGQVGLPGVMTLSDLNKLEADGMEIGAHTVLHRNLQTLSGDEAMRELCVSRNWLMDRGFDVYDMAYPYDLTNAAVKQAVAACGYNSARSGGQLQCDTSGNCSETVPPLDRYAIRTPNAFETTTTLAQMKAMVTHAETHGGGWVPLELHDVCDGPGDPLLPPLAGCTPPGYVTRALYRQFLDWLKGEVDAGRVQVKTVHEVVGGALQPQTPVAPAPVRTGNLLVNPSFEQAGTNGAPAACWADFTNGPDAPPTIARTTGAHTGSQALAITVPGNYDSWAYDFVAPALDLAQCSPAAVAGHRYTFTSWFKGNGPIKVAAFWRNADNQWIRLDSGASGTATFPLATSWTMGAFTFRAPAGATAISAGFYVDSLTRGHSYTLDDASLVDVDAPGPTSALTLNRAGTGNGDVSSNPAGIACGTTCLATFATGAAVTLSAVAAPGSSFSGWSGACSGTSATCTVTLSAALSVTASFAAVPVQLSVAQAGTGSGTITAPAGIACGGTCQTSVTYNAAVTLTAAAAPGSTFQGWSGACSGTSPTCTLQMNADRLATATFVRNPTLSLVKAGTGTGAVTSSQIDFACPATCTEQHALYGPGTTVTLTATASSGSTFTGWSEGACAGSLTCTVAVDADRAITATFTLDPPAAPTPPTAELPAAGDLPQVPAVVTPAAPVGMTKRPALKTPPKPRAHPKLSGRARVGRKLTCTRGTWTGSPSRYTFTWRRGQIVVGHGSAYVVRKADRGRAIRCSVTARNDRGSSTAASGALRVGR